MSTSTSPMTSSNEPVIDAPAADAVDAFGMTSSMTTNGNPFEADWTSSNGHVTYGSQNAAFIGIDATVQSSPVAAVTQNDGINDLVTSFSCGMQDEPAQPANWTSDWSNDKISSAREDVEVVDSMADNGNNHETGSSEMSNFAQVLVKYSPA
jgi:hypothetical protein